MPRLPGRVSIHPRGFGFVELDDPYLEVPLAFVAPPDLRPFVTGDRVTAEVEKTDKGLSAKALTLVERTRTMLFGEVVATKAGMALRGDREITNAEWPIEAYAQPLDTGAFVVGEIIGDLKVKIARVVPPAEGSLFRVIARHGLRVDFPDEVLEAASREPTLMMGGRRDLRSMPTVTIDAASTRDIDDALGVLPAAEDGALRLFVSIADVDAAVVEGSAIDREARRRATSVYLAGLVLPMIPHALSEKALSLLPGEDRATLTVELRIDPEGEVRSIDVYESVIRSTARLTYDGVAKLLDQNDASEVPAEVVQTLRWLRTAAARISAVRQGRGGVSLQNDEVHVALDEKTREPTETHARENTSAHVLVERLMVAANEAVARWLVDRGLPGAFRVHDAPNEERVAELSTFAKNFGFEPGFSHALTPRGLAAFETQYRGTPLAPAMQTVLGRALGPARYTVHPSIHFGLAAPLYAHFTSPIRRYADLVVHRIIKRFLSGKRDFVATDAQIESLCAHINERAYVASRAERERTWMLAARLYAKRIGERFRGNVVSIKPFGLVVQLQGTGVTGTIATEALKGGPFTIARAKTALVGDEKTYAIGDALDVEVVGANEGLGRIELAVV